MEKGAPWKVTSRTDKLVVFATKAMEPTALMLWGVDTLPNSGPCALMGAYLWCSPQCANPRLFSSTDP